MCLPCGKCTGCRTTNARAWALRCHLELQDHESAAFTTLTYSEQWLPPTLQKRDLQLFLKRLRKEKRIRFFASGEYGEIRQRPHYHLLLYGASLADDDLIRETWGKGLTDVRAITPANINYVAGYTQKKLNDAEHTRHERVDPDTGEVFHWQPPFIQMSRRPGIGANAKQWTSSWRSYAIYNGTKMAVPRFLHEAWKATATEQQLEQLAEEKTIQQQLRQITLQQLQAREEIQQARQAISAAKRNKL